MLVPDGPGLDRHGSQFLSASLPGNDRNDYLGVDGTEAWLLDANLFLVRADLGQTGVGAAAMIPHAESARLAGGSPPSFALVRPWAAPPFALRVGAQAVAVNGTKSPTVGAGRMRLILNDRYGHDLDEDGLSDAVERVYHLCDGTATSVGYWTRDGSFTLPCVTSSYFAAQRLRMLLTGADHTLATSDPRDTDGDGISDGAEVLGSDTAMGTTQTGACREVAATHDWIIDPQPQSDVDQTFPLWGFDPLRLDVLVEVDEAQVDPLCNASTCRSDGALFPTEACSSLDPGCVDRLNVREQQFWTWRQSYA
ncbi:MAG: thrombospondin type 3 repeat-containing protein, partial [Deltaproteobacteria bacterium]